MRIPNEIKAGLVVLMAAGIGFFFFAKTASIKQETYDIKTSFTYAGDLKANAVVKLSGIEVGRLREIDFVYEEEATRVECVLEILSSARVRKDSIAYIGTAGFVGDAFVGITPGVSPEFASPGSVIPGEDPVEMRVLMKKAEDIANNLDEILTEAKSIVTDNRPALNKSMDNLETITQNFKEFSEDVKRNPWKLLFKGEERD
jgi:phospholipid/cholesterol/gamma-HCH transport system substrate-binding protein